MVLKTLQRFFLVLIWMACLTPLQANSFHRLERYQQDQSHSAFENEHQHFKTALKKGNIPEALQRLSNMEQLLGDLKDVDHTPLYIALAHGYAQLNNAKKAKYYQNLATTTTRGQTKTFTIPNANLLAKSYILLNDPAGMKTMFEKVIGAAKTNKQPLQLAYANNLFSINDNKQAAAVLNHLYSNSTLTATEKAELLSLLIINCFKLNQLQRIEQYHQELMVIQLTPSDNRILAIGMYEAFKQRQQVAILRFKQLVSGFNAGKRETANLEGLLQLANLYSIRQQKDSADFYFNQLAVTLKKPISSTAIGINYLKFFQAHQQRFHGKSTTNDSGLGTKDSIFQQELLTATKELTYKHQLEENKQKAILIAKQRALENLVAEKKKQRMWWIISILTLLLFTGALIIRLLYQRKKQSSLLHEAELDRMKQQHKTDIIKKISASQEAERWRIADQLHDEVGSMISVVRLNLSEHPIKKEPITPEKLDTANRVLANLADTVREMSHELMPVAIRQYGLINAIEQLINDINTAGKIFIEHHIHGFEHPEKYPEDFQISFYRIIQELFQNIVKHAKATNAIFQLIEHPESINLYIEDNGKGIDNNEKDKNGKGIGLLTNRIDYFEGHISIEGSPGKGTLIMIDIPTLHMIEMENDKQSESPKSEDDD